MMSNLMKKLTSVGLLLALFASVLPWAAREVQAASLSTTRVSTTGGGNIVMAPGEVKTITVTFQNTGSSTWKNDGSGYISLYTYGPKYRTSSFDPGTWLSPSQVKRLIEPSIAPSATGTIAFQLRAPSTEGSYTETFNLASEDTAWIPGGEFALKITIKKPIASAPVTSGSSSTASADAAIGYTAQLVAQTASSLRVRAGRTISFTTLFENTGSQTWSSFGMKAPDVNLASTSVTSFHLSGSVRYSMSLFRGQRDVPPSGYGRIVMPCTCPSLQWIASHNQANVFVMWRCPDRTRISPTHLRCITVET